MTVTSEAKVLLFGAVERILDSMDGLSILEAMAVLDAALLELEMSLDDAPNEICHVNDPVARRQAALQVAHRFEWLASKFEKQIS